MTAETIAPVTGTLTLDHSSRPGAAFVAVLVADGTDRRLVLHSDDETELATWALDAVAAARSAGITVAIVDRRVRASCVTCCEEIVAGRCSGFCPQMLGSS